MFKPELWQSHNEYRTIVTKMSRRLSRNNPKYSFDNYEEERQKLLNLNLDPLLEYIPEFYSKAGRVLQPIRRRSCAPLSSLSCSSIRPRPGQALPYGSGMCSRAPFP